MCKKICRMYLITSNIVWLLISVLIVAFCIIRFVLPINLTMKNDTFMLIVPASIIQASISAAGLMAILSNQLWSLICYIIVIKLPLIMAIYWISYLISDLNSFNDDRMIILTVLTTLCSTWLLQIISAFYLFIVTLIKKRTKLNHTQLKETFH